MKLLMEWVYLAFTKTLIFDKIKDFTWVLTNATLTIDLVTGQYTWTF
ncbi:MAG: hypothetical protein HYZ16_04800 [Bacteroidetes bacterium]|nr:hypothetical protein [Bacteroidota bacterium]